MKLELEVSVILNYICHSALLQVQIGQDFQLETCQDGEEVPCDSCNRYMIGAFCYIFVEESKVLYLSIKNKIYRNGLPFLELLFIFLLILYFIYFVDQLLV